VRAGFDVVFAAGRGAVRAGRATVAGVVNTAKDPSAVGKFENGGTAPERST
jgi:hypothetical protein